jgi:hypothetical protein
VGKDQRHLREVLAMEREFGEQLGACKVIRRHGGDPLALSCTALAQDRQLQPRITTFTLTHDFRMI